MTLDDDAAKWASIPAETADKLANVAIGKPDVGFANNNVWHGAKDCSFTVKTAYATDGVYVWIDVTDDAVNPAPPPGSQPWLYDGLELFVDTRAIDERAGPYSKGAQQIMVIPQTGTAAAPCQVKNMAGANATVDATFVGHITDHGYVLEGRIAPKDPTAFALAPDRRFGLDFAVDDNDGQGRKVQVALHGSANDCVDTSAWGLYQLAGK
jgi:hypothetical protein